MWMLFGPRRRGTRRRARSTRAAGKLRAELLVEALESRAVPSTYYVSPAGDDGNPGTSPDLAWQSLTKVNQTAFQAGDAILFEGGATFAGSLTLDPTREPGTPASPITFASYGNGPATISSGAAAGLSAVNVGGLVLADLNFVGGPVNRTDGLTLASSRTDGPVSFLRIQGVDVGGYFGAGIHFTTRNLGFGFDDVQITQATIHDNHGDGIRTDGNSRYAAHAHTNFYIGHATAARNAGNGIYLSQVDGATVERCEAHDNGTSFQAGILAAAAANVTVQYNEAYANRNGLGFDPETTYSAIQYNYTHDNIGAGLRVAGLSGDPGAGLVLRYNISQNDARTAAYGISVHDTGPGVLIHNNVAFAATGHGAPVGIYDAVGAGPEVFNNLFITTGGVPVVNGAAGQFRGNAYWSSGAAFNFNGLPSLAAWRSIEGQETLNGQPTGYDINPLLTNPGGGGTVGDPDQLATLTAYQLQPTSPLIDGGLDLAGWFGIDPGPNDFYGTPLPQYNGYDVGAGEYADVLPDPPAAPSGLAVTGTTFRQVDLSWQRNSTNEGGFRITRSLDGVNFTLVSLVGVGVTHYSDTDVMPSTTYVYRVEAFNAAGAAPSPTVTATTPAPYLPPGWGDGDIGGPFRSGFASLDAAGGTWTVAGGGSDIWNNADQFHFAAGGFTGDGTIVARVTAIQNTDTWSKAGVMFRDGNAANAAFVDVVATSGQGVSFQWRPTAGGDPNSVTVAGITVPVWVRLTRSGNNFSAAYSRDGTTWTPVGSTIGISLSSTAQAGLAVTAHNNQLLNTARFTNVSLVPAGWADGDIGAPALPGGALLNSPGGTWTVSAAGSDIWNNADQFHFAAESFPGDGSATARVTALTNTNAWAKAGVMFRAGNSADAVFADVLATPGNGVSFQWRGTAGTVPSSVSVAGLTAPVWVRLVRAGDDFTASYSTDGVTWVQVGTTQTIRMGATALAGLAVTSHNTAAVTTAVFSNVSLLPAGWGDGDVGAPSLPGYTYHDPATGNWTIAGGGADIWNSADQFHFAAQGFAGDGSLTARVTSVQNTNVWAKAGVMFRDSADPGARFVDMLVTPGNGVAFQWRTAPNAVPTNVNVTGHNAPVWVRLVRAGNAFSGYYSNDGVTWTQVGTTQTVSINPAALAGLAVTAHDDTALSTATLSNVTFLPAGAPGAGNPAFLARAVDEVPRTAGPISGQCSPHAEREGYTAPSVNSDLVKPGAVHHPVLLRIFVESYFFPDPPDLG